MPSPSSCNPLCCFYTDLGATAEQDSQCLARLSAIFEFPTKFVSLLCEASSLTIRSELIDTPFLMGRCWGGEALVQKHIWGVQVGQMVPDGVVMGEVHGEDVATSFPGTIFRPRDLTMPLEHVDSAIIVFKRLCNKSEGVIAPPLFALFFQSVDDEFVNLFLLHQNIISPPIRSGTWCSFPILNFHHRVKYRLNPNIGMGYQVQSYGY